MRFIVVQTGATKFIVAGAAVEGGIYRRCCEAFTQHGAQSICEALELQEAQRGAANKPAKLYQGFVDSGKKPPAGLEKELAEHILKGGKI